jgi:hypothetical protein
MSTPALPPAIREADLGRLGLMIQGGGQVTGRGNAAR